MLTNCKASVFLFRTVTYDSGISPSAVVEKITAISFTHWKLYFLLSVPGFNENNNCNSGTVSLLLCVADC